MPLSTSDRRLNLLTRIVLLTAIYFVGAVVGQAGSFKSGTVALVWPPFGIGLAALLLFGQRYLAGIALGTVLYTVLNGWPLGVYTFCAVVGDCIGALLCVYLLERFVHFENSMRRIRDVAGLAGLACLLGPALTAQFHVVGQLHAGVGNWENLLAATVSWWVPNAMAGMVVTPFLLSWGTPAWKPWGRWQLLEAAVCGGGLLLGASLAFNSWYTYGIGHYPLAFLPYPFLVWASVRFGQRGATTGTLLVSSVAIYSLLQGRGPFVADHQNESLLLIGTYIGTLAVTNLMLAAAVLEREFVEGALGKSQEMFNLITNHVGDLIAVTDAQGKRLYNSASYHKILGDPHRLAGTDAFREIHPDDLARVRGVFERSLREQTGEKTEFRFLLPDGGVRHIESVGGFVQGERGEPGKIVTVARDITDRKQLEEIKGKLEAQLRQAQKMEAIGTLAGGIAHDFNNLLGSIIGYTELALMELDQPEVVREHLQTVLQAGKSAKDLVQQILTFSRQAKPERKPLKLQSLVKEVLKLMRSTLPATVEMAARIDENAPAVLADPIQVHQVLMNLCTNAAYAMQGRPGRLEISLELVEVEETLARSQPDLRKGPYVRLGVKDTGHGMDSQVIKRIFDPFFTTKPPGEGTGLGLSVVHGIMKEHDGAILVSSRVGQGTTFHAYFPVYPVAVPPAEAEKVHLHYGQGEHILVVDDEEMLCEMAVVMLEVLGYRVTGQTEPLQALQRFRADPTGFDLIITDLTMPKMTGTDLARQAMEIRPEVPVLLMTGFSSAWTTDRARELGIRDVVPKPFTHEILAEVIHRALRARNGETAQSTQSTQSTAACAPVG